MIHSYSSLADYQQCPRYFKAKYIDKVIPWVESAAMARGNRLHKDMENVIERGAALPKEFKGNKQLIALLRKFKARTEVRIGNTADWRGCHFFHDDVKLRGKLDVYLPITEKKACLMIDWKSGNPNYTDLFQSDVYGAMIAGSTSLERTLFIWQYFSGEVVHRLVDGLAAREKVGKAIAKADADTEFAPRPCWKCRFCELKSCEYNENKEVFDA